MMVVLAGLALAVGVFSHNSLVGGKSQLLDKQAFYIAEAGGQRVHQALHAGTWTAATSPGNTYTESFGSGEYRVTIVNNGNGTYTITSEGYVPNQTTTVARRQTTETNVPVTPAGTNLSLNATASASSTDGSLVPANAKDGDVGTKWGAAVGGNGEWLAMDFGRPRNFDRILIREEGNVVGVNLQWSDDGSAWTNVANQSNVEDADGKNWTCTFPAIAHRYVRAVFQVSGSNKAAINELGSYSNWPNLDQGAVTTQW